MWKNLKSYFIVEEDKPVRKAKTLPNKTPPASKSTPAPASAPPQENGAPRPQTQGGTVNDRSIKVLMEAMESANLPGFDYLEFKKSLQNLKKMDFTDSVRFQTAYAAAQAMGVTPQQLQDSATHYLNVLEKEHQKFLRALAGQRQQQVGDKEARLQQIDVDVQRQEAKIKELQQQIEKSRADHKKLKTSIERSAQKLTQTKADFETTLGVITKGIEQDMQHMREFLK